MSSTKKTTAFRLVRATTSPTADTDKAAARSFSAPLDTTAASTLRSHQGATFAAAGLTPMPQNFPTTWNLTIFAPFFPSFCVGVVSWCPMSNKSISIISCATHVIRFNISQQKKNGIYALRLLGKQELYIKDRN